MDVIIDILDEKEITIEIWFFATVLEIKKTIQKQVGYPVDAQKLVFNGVELADELDTEHYDILEGSRIHLSFIESTDSC